MLHPLSKRALKLVQEPLREVGRVACRSMLLDSQLLLRHPHLPGDDVSLSFGEIGSLSFQFVQAVAVP